MKKVYFSYKNIQSLIYKTLINQTNQNRSLNVYFKMKKEPVNIVMQIPL